MGDIGFFRAGELVWVRGRFSADYSVRGTVEEVMPTVNHGKITGVHKYGIRFENGNYRLCDPNQVKGRS